MPVPEDNPITPEKIEQGRELFADRRLSRDGSVACTSCHDPARAFSTPEPVPPGVFGRRGRRNAPALVNRGWGRAFFWDARASTLEQQVLGPIEDPNEMDLPIADASARVGLPVDDIARALATYIRSLMSGDSPYDRYTAGDRTALTGEQQAGLQLFRGKAHCTACHLGPNLTDERVHNTGIAWSSAPSGFTGAGHFLDEGRAAVTGQREDRGAFKTPTLREVGRTSPYMHDGSLASLDEVVDFYDRGGRANPNLDPDLHPLRLTNAEKRALMAFLRALSANPALAVGAAMGRAGRLR
jgi:cytochrome c peroxidase